MWIVDPIDGTRNYAAGIQIWANLLALKVDGEYVMGLANAPALGERYAAHDGRWRDVERPRDPGLGYHDDGRWEVVLGDLEAWAGTPRGDELMRLIRGAKRNRGFGDFWGHMLVARGAAEVMIEPELSEWDFASLAVIVTEAGGRVTQVDGSPPVHGGSLVSSNALVHDEVLAALTTTADPAAPTA